MIRPKNKTEELLLSSNKSCETLFTQITQNHEKQKNLNFTNPEKLSHLNHQSRWKDLE